MNTKGIVTISKIVLANGQELPIQKAIDYGWICPAAGRQPTGWGLERHEVVVGHNLILDQFRQCVAYAMGFRSPIQNYTLQRFGVGTGLTAARVTDTALEAPITLSNGSTTKAIDFIDYISPFVLRVAYTLGIADANGYIISEMGLYTGANILVARKIRAVSVNKVSDYAVTLCHRLRV